MLNKFLSSAVQRLPKELKQALICPIGETDAKIITEIIKVLKGINLNEISSLLEQWKFLKDSEILEALFKWHTESTLEQESVTDKETGTKPIKSSSESPYTRNFIYFKDFRLDLRFICAYEKQDEYDFVKGKMSYKIIINALPSTTEVRNTTTHKEITYSSIEQRDRDFEALDIFMESFNGIKFINKR